jgi:DNA ligase-4
MLLQHYAPRFSRITKVYRSSERSWTTAVLLKDLDTMARTAVGLERANKEVDDDVKRMWGLTASPSLSSTPARRRRERMFVEQLQDAERVPLQKRTRTLEFERVDHEQKSSPVSQKRRREPSSSSASTWPKRPARVLESINNTFHDGPTRTVPCDLDCQALGLASASSPFTSGGADIALLPGGHRASLCGTPVSLLPPVPPVLSLAPSSDGFIDGNFSITVRKTFRIADLLQEAVVWLARSSSRPRPTTRPSIRNLAPQALVIHDWNAFLVACGWDDGRPIPNSHIGVVFVNVQEDGGKVEWIKQALHLVMARDSAGHLGRAHPIVVLDERLLQYGELDREHDLEAEAIFQVGSGL